MPSQCRKQAIRQVRQRSQLRDYLAYPQWSSHQASWIIAGLDPELTMGGAGNWAFQFLPGGCRPNWLGADGSVDDFTLEKHVEMELEIVQGFVSGTSMSPGEWTALARRSRYGPPWLQVALADTKCRGHLLMAAVGPEPGARERKGGREKARNSPAGRAKREVLRGWDLLQVECRSLGAPERDAREKRFWSEVRKKYLGVEKDKESPGATVSTSPASFLRWKADLEKERSGDSGIKWPKELREERNKLV